MYKLITIQKKSFKPWLGFNCLLLSSYEELYALGLDMIDQITIKVSPVTER
jgi:hypothetical protein